MLVLDEAHKLRNLYGVENPPQVAKRFRKALEERRFRFVLMLTATPIQNRLWDLYSLVDLLTVARGHQNPFGSEGMFARKFIADNREQARQLKPEARDEFRSIVYGYMSRVRRGDAKLYFPDRVVQMHKVDPTAAELQLISAIAKPIQKLNRLAQISILQALTSSPDALMAQLNNMARNGTVPQELAATVRAIVTGMPTSAKLQGLGGLIDQTKAGKSRTLASGRVHRAAGDADHHPGLSGKAWTEGRDHQWHRPALATRRPSRASERTRLIVTSSCLPKLDLRASTFKSPMCWSTTTCPGTR